jgi:hypothetical protein
MPALERALARIIRPVLSETEIKARRIGRIESGIFFSNFECFFGMPCYGKACRYAQLIYLVKSKITVLKALKLHSLKNLENHPYCRVKDHFMDLSE